MQTIIISFLKERALSQEDLFFFPFDREELVLMNSTLDAMPACVDSLCKHLDDEIVRQEYQLILLTDLSAFAYSKLSVAREPYQKIMSAIFARDLLIPFSSRVKVFPTNILEIFICPRMYEKKSKGLNEEEAFAAVLGVSVEKPDLSCLRLAYEDKNQTVFLDVSSLFQDNVDYLQSAWQSKNSQDVISGAPGHIGEEDSLMQDLRAVQKDSIESGENQVDFDNGIFI